MELKERVQAIKNELKANKITTKQVNIKGSIQGYDEVIKISIKDLSINKLQIENITNKYIEVSRCETSGEILHGGNTYVYIELNKKSIKEGSNDFTEIAKNIINKSKEYKNFYEAFIDGNRSILYSRENNQIRLSEKNDGIGTGLQSFQIFDIDGIAEALTIFKYQYGFNF